jgi:acyl-CoA thioester hydrolase
MSTSREEYRSWLAIPTRWEDFDVYGHVNNVKYYAYFDTLINEFLIQVGGLDPVKHPVIGYIAESRCTFKGSFTFPEIIEGGLSVERIGGSSVTYRLGLFRENEPEPRAFGHCTHVFVLRDRGRPTAIPEQIRAALEQLKYS